jgi:hypothetical protein
MPPAVEALRGRPDFECLLPGDTCVKLRGTRMASPQVADLAVQRFAIEREPAATPCERPSATMPSAKTMADSVFLA